MYKKGTPAPHTHRALRFFLVVACCGVAWLGQRDTAGREPPLLYMLSSFVVLNASGHTVFEKHWRQVLPRAPLNELWQLVQKTGMASAAPVQSVGKLSMVHVVRGGMLLVGVLDRDVPALLVVELLHRVGDLLELYLQKLSEDALRGNFVTVYQLLDEVIDNGMPLHTEPNVLQQLVMQPGKMDSIVASVTGSSHVRGALPESANSSSPWRRSGVRHTANEVYLDLVERVDATIDGSNGVLQRAEVWGVANCNCQLSGMPRLTLTFTMPQIVEDATLHVCVNRERWERERALSFVPPDGTLRPTRRSNLSCLLVHRGPRNGRVSHADALIHTYASCARRPRISC